MCNIEKPLSEFYRNRTKPLGRSYYCKSCDDEKKRQKGPCTQRWRKWAERNREHVNAYAREYQRRRRKERPDVYREYAQKRYRDPRERARWELRNAVKAGRITKPDHCEECGQIGRLHGHHEDYARPLEVVWLCPECHRNKHKQVV